MNIIVKEIEMSTYTYSEARQHLASLLKKAREDGKALITRKHGSVFEVKYISEKKSPLDVKGVNININRDEIIEILNEVRKH